MKQNPLFESLTATKESARCERTRELLKVTSGLESSATQQRAHKRLMNALGALVSTSAIDMQTAIMILKIVEAC
jgi:hypothetical protein